MTADPIVGLYGLRTCKCGIYAALSFTWLEAQYPISVSNVVAVISAEGQTILGDSGFRTQYARVVAYWCKEELRLSARRQFRGARSYASVSQMVSDYGLEM